MTNSHAQRERAYRVLAWCDGGGAARWNWRDRSPIYTCATFVCICLYIYVRDQVYARYVCVCECLYLDAGLNNFVLYLLSVCDCLCTCIGRYFMKLTATAMRASSEPTPNRDHLMLCYAMLCCGGGSSTNAKIFSKGMCRLWRSERSQIFARSTTRLFTKGQVPRARVDWL